MYITLLQYYMERVSRIEGVVAANHDRSPVDTGRAGIVETVVVDGIVIPDLRFERGVEPDERRDLVEPVYRPNDTVRDGVAGGCGVPVLGGFHAGSAFDGDGLDSGTNSSASRHALSSPGGNTVGTPCSPASRARQPNSRRSAG